MASSPTAFYPSGFGSTLAAWLRSIAYSSTVAQAVRSIAPRLHEIEFDSEVSWLSVRTRNALVREGHRRISDLLVLSDAEIASTRNFGRESFLDLLRGLAWIAQLDEEQLRRYGDQLRTPDVHVPEVMNTPAPTSLWQALEATAITHRWGGLSRFMILRARLGVGDATPPTLEVVGKRVGVTRERVRQHCAKLFRHLRSEPVGLALLHILQSTVIHRGFVTVEELACQHSWISRGLSLERLGMILRGFDVMPIVNVAGVGDVVCAGDPVGVVDYLTLLIRTSAERHPRTWSERFELARSFVAESGSPQFFESSLRIVERISAERKVNLTEFVRTAFAESPYPLHVDDLVERALQEKIELPIGSARNIAALLPGVYPLGHHRYGTLSQVYPVWDEHLDTIARLLDTVVREQAQRQWHAYELLSIVREKMGSEAAHLVGDGYQLAMVLREKTRLAYVGRLIFVSPENADNRHQLFPLACEILRVEGRPLPKGVLIARIREKRGFTDFALQAAFAGLDEVAPGMWGLPATDIPLTPTEQAILCEDAWAMMRPGVTRRARDMHRDLVRQKSSEALRVTAPLFHAVLKTDARFHVTSGGAVMLAPVHVEHPLSLQEAT